MDAKTILIINGIYSIIISAFIILIGIAQKKNSSFKKWGISFALFAINFILLSLRDGLPLIIAGVLPHIVTFIAFVLIKSGLTDILKIKVNKKVDATLVILGIIGVLYFNNVTNIKAYIVIVMQSLIIFETWIICYREKTIDEIKRKIILGTFGISIILQIARFIISISWFSQLDPLSLGSGLPYMSMLFFIIYILMSLTIISIILRKRVNEQKILIEELKRVTLYDKLTGIYNRRGFHQLFDYEYKLKKREDEEKEKEKGYVIAMCDVDDFKSVNDNYGHDIGDQVLRYIADKITGATRETDIVARWGGEEFLIYISNVNDINGKVVVDKILKAFQNSIFSYEKIELKITLSIGAMYTKGTRYQLDELVSAADKELYNAKKNGKNQVKYQALINDEEL